MRRSRRRRGGLTLAAGITALLSGAGPIAADTLPWPKTNPPQRLWQTRVDGLRSNQILYDVGADGAVLVAESPTAQDETREIRFIWLDRGGTIIRRASANEKTVGALSYIALQPDGGVLLATLRRTDQSFGKAYIARLDPTGRIVYARPATTQPTSPGGAEFPGFARRPLAGADGGALFVASLANPAPASSFYLERVDGRGRPLWQARFAEGFKKDGLSHHLLDIRFVEGGETALLYVGKQTLTLRRFGKRGEPRGAVTAIASIPDDRYVYCGAMVELRTVLTVEGPGPESRKDVQPYLLAWHEAGKGKVREQRFLLDEAQPATCEMYAMGAGGALLGERRIGLVRLDGKGAPLWSLPPLDQIDAGPGLVTTFETSGEDKEQRLTVTRYADKAAE